MTVPINYKDKEDDVLHVRREEGRIYFKTGPLGVNIPLKDYRQLLEDLTAFLPRGGRKPRSLPKWSPSEAVPGSVWEDNDPIRKGRTIRIEAVVGDRVHYVQLTDSEQVKTNIALGTPKYKSLIGREGKVRLAAFDPRARGKGYKPYVPTPEGESNE